MFILYFFFGFLSVVLVRSHFLMVLMCMEFIFLSLTLVFFLYFNLVGDVYFGVVFLVLGVCDGALGLSLLVYLVRSVGGDTISSFNLC
nr:NADH dehydrogenase subunit 4L [Borysthenes sp. 2 WQW-2023a]